MKYSFALLLAICLGFKSYGQESLKEMKANLTGDLKKRWVFYNMEETSRNGKTKTTSDCVYNEIVFGLPDTAYIANRCFTAEIVKGFWQMEQKNNKTLLLVDRVYEVSFKYKELLDKERFFMLLTIRGKDKNTPTQVYYFVED